MDVVESSIEASAEVLEISMEACVETSAKASVEDPLETFAKFSVEDSLEPFVFPWDLPWE